MFKTGLVSITFRELSTEKIIELGSEAGLDGIEWGGDVHVPHGEIKTAKEVGNKTRDAGLSVSSYGSYYRLNETTDFSFDDVLKTARALDTNLIRVWAGDQGSDEADEQYWQNTAEEARKLAEKCRLSGIRLAVEWHGGSLTDTAEAAARFFDMADHDNLYTYWQPRACTPPEVCLKDMDAALPHLTALHVFNWHTETKERLPLKEAKKTWSKYLEKARQAGDMYALLEFVANDDPDQFLEDAATLKELTRNFL